MEKHCQKFDKFFLILFHLLTLHIYGHMRALVNLLNPLNFITNFLRFQSRNSHLNFCNQSCHDLCADLRCLFHTSATLMHFFPQRRGKECPIFPTLSASLFFPILRVQPYPAHLQNDSASYTLQFHLRSPWSLLDCKNWLFQRIPHLPQLTASRWHLLHSRFRPFR